MTLTLWLTFGLVTLMAAALLRLSVRFLARGADNGWDNAIGYVLLSGLVGYFTFRWAFGAGWWALLFLAPLVLWVAQVATLRIFYQITTGRAVLLGVAHTFLTSTVLTTVATIAGVIAAYILYGKIVSDPMFLLRLILRLIGLELPADLTPGAP